MHVLTLHDSSTWCLQLNLCWIKYQFIMLNSTWNGFQWFQDCPNWTWFFPLLMSLLLDIYEKKKNHHFITGYYILIKYEIHMANHVYFNFKGYSFCFYFELKKYSWHALSNTHLEPQMGLSWNSLEGNKPLHQMYEQKKWWVCRNVECLASENNSDDEQWRCVSLSNSMWNSLSLPFSDSLFLLVNPFLNKFSTHVIL